MKKLPATALIRRRCAVAIIGMAVIASLVSCNGGDTTDVTLSSDASLSALRLSSGSLNPAFAAATTSYEVVVPNTTASLTITPTAANSGATIRVNGTVVASGSPTPITLVVGTTAVSVVVTAANGTTLQTYTVSITRSPPVGTA